MKKKILLIILLIVSIVLIFIPSIVLLSANFYTSTTYLLQDFLTAFPFTLLGIIGVSTSLKKLLEN